MSEVTDEEQAAMTIKLSDNVRQLIRDEVKAALEDWAFLNSFYKGTLAQAIMSEALANTGVQNALAQAVAAKLMKY